MKMKMKSKIEKTLSLPFVNLTQHALCTLYDIIFLAPSMPFFLCHTTNPNPMFYKEKNMKIN